MARKKCQHQYWYVVVCEHLYYKWLWLEAARSAVRERERLYTTKSLEEKPNE